MMAREGKGCVYLIIRTKWRQNLVHSDNKHSIWSNTEERGQETLKENDR